MPDFPVSPLRLWVCFAQSRLRCAPCGHTFQVKRTMAPRAPGVHACPQARPCLSHPMPWDGSATVPWEGRLLLQLVHMHKGRVAWTFLFSQVSLCDQSHELENSISQAGLFGESVKVTVTCFKCGPPTSGR